MDREGKCYIWDKTNGGPGSCEIGTFLINYLCALPRNVKEVVLYSDTCGGQNRNQFVTIGLWYAMSKNTSLVKVSQKFFEKGHSVTECDSMHAAIEHSRKTKTCLSPLSGTRLY